MKKRSLLVLFFSFLAVSSLSSCSSSTSYSLKKTELGKVKFDVFAPTSVVENSIDIEKRTNFNAFNTYTSKYATETAYIHRYKYIKTTTSGMFGCSKSSSTVFDIYNLKIVIPRVEGVYCDSISLDGGQTTFKKGIVISPDYTEINLVSSFLPDNRSGLHLGNQHEYGHREDFVSKVKKIKKVNLTYQPYYYQFKFVANEVGTTTKAFERTVEKLYYYNDNLLDLNVPTIEEMFPEKHELYHLFGFYNGSSSGGYMFSDEEGRLYRWMSYIANDNFIIDKESQITNAFEETMVVREISLNALLARMKTYQVVGAEYAFNTSDVLENNGLPYRMINDKQFQGYFLDQEYTQPIKTAGQLPLPSANDTAPIKIYAKYENATQGLIYNGNEVSETILTGEAIIPDMHEGVVIDRIKSMKNSTIVRCPKTITDISEQAFYNNTNLMELYLSERVNEIKDNTFRGCVSLKKIEGLENVVTFGENVFMGCTSLEQVNLNKKELSLPSSNMFSGCTNLKKITGYGAVDGVLYVNNVLYCYPAGKTNPYYVFPETLIRIPANAFDGNENLKEVYFPSEKLEVVADAFRNSAITSVKFTGDTATIRQGSFSGMLSIRDVYFLNTKTNLPSGGAAVESLIMRVHYLSSIDSTIKAAFEGYADYYPFSVIKTNDAGDKYALDSNGKLVALASKTEALTISGAEYGNNLVIGENMFGNNSTLTTLTFGDGVSSIGDNAFRWANNLTRVYVDTEEVITIGTNVFPNGIFVYVHNSVYSAYVAAWPQYASYIETF